MDKDELKSKVQQLKLQQEELFALLKESSAHEFVKALNCLSKDEHNFLMKIMKGAIHGK